MKSLKHLPLDPFLLRQFKQGSTGYINYNQQKFQEKVNQLAKDQELIEGYAPFCKHIFIQNFTDGVQNVCQITKENQHLLKTAYQARTQKQLPVLKRFFPLGSVELQKAKYLDLILYSKQQIQKQNQAMNSVDPNKDKDYDYAVISVKFQNQPKQTPMDPITMMRNSLGKQQGGSGVPLQRQKYMQSVKYWQKRAFVK